MTIETDIQFLDRHAKENPETVFHEDDILDRFAWLGGFASAFAAKFRHMRSDLELSRAEADRFKRDHLAACETVAAMHAAAIGESAGPRRGVVEDVQDLRDANEYGKGVCRRLAQELIETKRDMVSLREKHDLALKDRAHYYDRCAEFERVLADRDRELHSLREQIVALTNDRHQLQERCTELERGVTAERVRNQKLSRVYDAALAVVYDWTRDGVPDMTELEIGLQVAVERVVELDIRDMNLSVLTNSIDVGNAGVHVATAALEWFRAHPGEPMPLGWLAERVVELKSTAANGHQRGTS